MRATTGSSNKKPQLPQKEKLDATIKARIPLELKNRIEEIAIRRHTNAAFIAREALREKVEQVEAA